MTREPPSVYLTLSSFADNVAVVRAALTGFGEALSFSQELSADLRTGVSEACNNVSIHAYPDGQAGPMWVSVSSLRDGVEATVTDSGRGITRISTTPDRMGLGLGIINALADQTEFRRAPGGGAEVRMWFERTETADPDPGSADAVRSAPPNLFDQTAGDVVVWCTRPQLQQAVLARVLGYMAACAHFSMVGIDGVRDAGAAVAGHVRRAAEAEWIGARITSTPRRLELTVGPLVPVEPPAELPRSVEMTHTQPLDGHELLQVTIVDQAQAV